MGEGQEREKGKERHYIRKQNTTSTGEQKYRKEEEEGKGEEGPARKQRLVGLKQTFAKCAYAHL